MSQRTSRGLHAAIIMDRNIVLIKSEELEKLTSTDHLTGLANRRYLLERLQGELARSERHDHRLSLLMLDLDDFKHCNDTQGHLFGDKVLKDFAAIIVNTIRSIDIASRYGGDEFIIILPETNETLAVDIAERLRSNVAKKLSGSTMVADRGKGSPTTVSIGIACFPDHGSTTEHLLANADTALYTAKRCGRNRIEVYHDTQDKPKFTVH